MHYPTISVLIPIRNEEKNIKNCLQQIAQQTYAKNKLEIWIIDGDSQDKTLNIIQAFQATAPDLKIHVLSDKNQQRSSGLNKGIHHATGEIILRIDARTIIPPDYIEACVKTLLETGADNVGGIQKSSAEEVLNTTQLAIGYAMAHPFGVGNAQFRLGKKSGLVDSVYLGCFNKTIFSKIGFFDEESSVISEDSDLNYRIRKQGGKVYLNKDIVAYYVPRERLSDLARLYFRYGGARAGFMLKWKTFTGYRQLVPPLFLLTLVLLPLLALIAVPFFYLWLFLFLSYLCGNLLAASSIVKKNKRWQLFSKLLCIFPIMHFAWALGFWKRLLQGNKNKYWGY